MAAKKWHQEAAGGGAYQAWQALAAALARRRLSGGNDSVMAKRKIAA